MPAVQDVIQDLAIRRRGAAPEAESESGGANQQTAAGTEEPARASGLLGASATAPDVVARAQVSVALQQSVGNARMASLLEPVEAPRPAPAGPSVPLPAPTPAPVPAPAAPAPAPAAANAPPPPPAAAPEAAAAQEVPAAAEAPLAPEATAAAPGAAEAPAAPPAAAAPGATEGGEAAAPAAPAASAEAAGTAGKSESPPIKPGAPKGGGQGAAAGAAEAESAEAGEPGAGRGGGARAVVMKMPEPPADLSTAARTRVKGATSRAGKTAAAQAVLPLADTQVAQARGAVDEPIEETKARASQGVVTALGTRPQPDPKIEELCQQIYKVIKAKRPPDEDQLVKADPEAMANAAGDKVRGDVQKGAESVDQGYDDLNKPPSGTPQQQGQSIDPPPDAAATPGINATSATPDAVPAKNVSLDADAAATKQKAQDAGMESEPAKLVQNGPIAEARAAQGELEDTAKADPAKVLAEQQASLVAASADMAALQQKAVAALTASRKATTTSTGAKQTQMVGSEESMRTKVSADAQAIFAGAQTQVNAQLQPLPATAMKKWDAGVKVASEKFKQRLHTVEEWIKDRHSGGFGSLVSFWDDLTGLPGWVTEEYDAAEEQFGNEICALAREISTDVNGVIMICEAIIANARTSIAALFAALPINLQTWALGEQAKFGQQLEALHGKTVQVRENFTKDLVNRAGQAVQDVREQIHALREKAKGLIGRVLDAIGRFFEDPVKFIINGLLDLLGIPPASFWAVVAKIEQVISDIADDPIGFANNLMAAVGKGFEQFFDHILEHLLHGFMDWLTGGLAGAGVQMPADFSPKSLITFFLQLMGITWPRIRRLLVKHIGAENVALIEKAYSIVANLVALGPEGIFEMIKEKLDPKTIINQIIKAAVDYLVKAVVKAVSARILLLFNPAGAILQALEAIYRVLKWIFTNAARIFRLIETVVNGIADVIAGNIGAMANAVETALAGLVAPVIDFLADYLGFGDLPEKIRDTIISFQEWVEGILDQVIGWLVEKGKALLAAVGLGGEDEEDKDRKKKGEGVDLSAHVPFTADGEGHELWIDVEGADAVLMVASDEPLTIPDRLTKWSSEADDLSNKAKKGQETPRAKAKRLIGEAEPLTSKTDKTAENLIREAQVENASEEEGAAAAAPDHQTEQQELSQEEHELADKLKQLFELFGEHWEQPSVRWKDDLDKMQAFGSTWAGPELDKNEAEVKAYEEWTEVRGWLEARAPLTDPLAGDLADDFWKEVARTSELVRLGHAAGFTDAKKFGTLEKAALAREVAAGSVSDLKGRLLRWMFESKGLNASASVKDFVKDTLQSSDISNETGATKTAWYHEWGIWKGGELDYAYPKHVSWKDGDDLSSAAWDMQQHHIWPRYLMGPDVLVGIRQKLHIVHFHNGVQYPLFDTLGFPKGSAAVRAEYKAEQALGRGSAYITSIRAGLADAYIGFEAVHVVNSGFASHCTNQVATIPTSALKT